MPVWVISDDRQRAWYQKGHSGSAIPVDEVIDAMRRIGADMSDTLKETARGGLATTRTALEVKNRLKM